MRIQLVSDTHFEFFSRDREVLEFLDCLQAKGGRDMETTLLLAGDIHRGSRLPWVLHECAERWSHVVYVPGNHEYYGSSIAQRTAVWAGLDRPNLHILNPGTVQVGDFRIVGATLWTDLLQQSPAVVNHVVHSLNDFRKIQGFLAEKWSSLHRRDLDFLQRQLGAGGGGTIALTHHLPSFSCVSPRFRDSLLNHGFASDLDDLILELRPALWLFGHGHDSVDFVLGDTRLLSNPFGYRNYEENSQFSFNLTFEL